MTSGVPESAPPPRTARILAVDDAAANLVALERTLASVGAEIVRASSGEAALTACMDGAFALAIVDVQMPGMDGYELAEILRADPATSHMPILFVTAAYADEAHLFRGYDAGGVDYLVKPYDPGVLVAKVRVFLELARHRDDLEALVAERTRALRESEQRYRSLCDALLDSEQALRAVFEGTRDGMIAIDAESRRVVMANDALVRMFGLARTDVDVGADVDAVLPAAAAARARDQGAGSGEAPASTDLEVTRRDGQTIGLDVRVSTVELGRRRCLLCAFRDVTERRRAEAERQRLQEELFRAQKMESVGLLAGGIAHDFNNLLSVILGNVGFVLDRLAEGDPIREDLVDIQLAGERSAELTRQLLAFSRKQVMQRAPIDLNRVATGVERVLGRVLGETVTLTLGLDAAPGVVSADAGQIEQVLVNLAVNARDAMPRGGSVVIATANVDVDAALAAMHPELRPGAYVRLRVRDAGTGIDAATLPHIFEPFFTTKPKSRGTGLGLATVYGIVKQSDGHVVATSVVGVGTTIDVYLPRLDVPAAPVPVARPPSFAAPRGGDETILVVEDADAVRGLAARALRDVGYHVLVAADGAAAMRVAADHAGPVHLLLTDVVMPGIGGEELAERLTRLRPDVLVLYMSGYTERAFERDGVSERPPNLVDKPFTVDHLQRRVRELLDRAARDRRGDRTG